MGSKWAKISFRGSYRGNKAKRLDKSSMFLSGFWDFGSRLPKLFSRLWVLWGGARRKRGSHLTRTLRQLRHGWFASDVTSVVPELYLKTSTSSFAAKCCRTVILFAVRFLMFSWSMVAFKACKWWALKRSFYVQSIHHPALKRAFAI